MKITCISFEKRLQNAAKSLFVPHGMAWRPKNLHLMKKTKVAVVVGVVEEDYRSTGSWPHSHHWDISASIPNCNVSPHSTEGRWRHQAPGPQISLRLLW